MRKPWWRKRKAEGIPTYLADGSQIIKRSITKGAYLHL
jgi:hypothetical protein